MEAATDPEAAANARVNALVRALEDAKAAADWLSAVELSHQLVDSNPSIVEYRYERALAYAKAGAPHVAHRHFEEDRLGEHAAQLSHSLRVDVLSLRGRLLKDAARSSREFRDAALAYAEVDPNDSYPLVNAATLFVLGGDMPSARAFAERALNSTAKIAESYWREATRAEAQLILGDEAGAAESLAIAATLPDCDHATSATTRKQLRALLTALGLTFDVLAPLQALVPQTIHYVGRRFRAGLSEESKLVGDVKDYVERANVRFGFGSLAAGSDIVVAEALIERGELTIVLPFNIGEFVERSVADMGDGWTYRFERILSTLRAREAATHRTFVHFATRDDDQYLNDDLLYGYASRFAMGLAILQARALFAAPLRQLALWNGEPEPSGVLAGAAHDVGVWNAAGNETHHLAVNRAHRAPAPPLEGSFREARAMMFGDFHGFSKLREVQLAPFVEHVMGSVAAALRPYEPEIIFRNTWGDGLYLVLATAPTAARCALAMQRAMERLPLAKLGFAEDLRLRLGIHFGPIRRLLDPVTARESFFGEHVSRTARIEPVTIPGEVYATERFAAELALHTVEDIACEFVGYRPLAKNYMMSRLYMLRPTASAHDD